MQIGQMGDDPPARDVAALLRSEIAMIGGIDVSDAPKAFRDDVAALTSGFLAMTRNLERAVASPPADDYEKARAAAVVTAVGDIVAQIEARTMRDAALAGVVVPELASCWTEAAAILFENTVLTPPDPAGSKVPAVQEFVNALGPMAERQWLETLSPLPPAEAAKARERDLAYVGNLSVEGLPENVLSAFREYVDTLRESVAALREPDADATTFKQIRNREAGKELSLWASIRHAGADEKPLSYRWVNGMTTGPARLRSTVPPPGAEGAGADRVLGVVAARERETDWRIRAENADRNFARMAELRREMASSLSRTSTDGCPPSFVEAFRAYLRAQEGIAATLDEAAGVAALPEERSRDRAALLVSEIGRRATGLCKDRAALLREVRRSGIGPGCKAAAALWPDAAALAVLSELAGLPATPPSASRNPQVRKYLDDCTALFRAARDDLERAAGGAAGAAARLAAIRTLFTGLRDMDVSALPPGVRKAHAAQLEAYRKTGIVMKKLSDAAAKGTDAFERAAAALEPEQQAAEKAMGEASSLLKDSAVRAGLDPSEIPEEFF